ncbi:MAG: type I secretion system permease/ATPase [Proteobacteria bacterium]|nr:type I secretion system permease/ATPase [Pseudomonadota bacterium]
MAEHQKAQVPADFLLESLVFVTGYFGHTRSATSLLAGLPVGKGGLTPKLFCQAADRAGFKAKIVKRALDQVPPEVMPCIAVTRDKSAVILLQRSDKSQYRVLNPVSREEKAVAVRELGKNHSGYCIYIKPDYQSDDAEGGSFDNHWFWSNILESRGIYRRVLLSALLINLFALTSPIFTMNFYDRVLPSNAAETGWVLAIGAGSIYIFDLIIRTLRGYFIDVAGRRADVILAQKLFNQVLDMRLGTHSGSVGAFANNLREFDSLREFFNSATMTGLVDFPFSLLFVLVIWMIGGAGLSILLLVFYAIVVTVGYLMQLPVRKKVHRALKTGEQKHGLLVETLGNLEMIKGIGGEGQIRASYAHYVAAAAEAGQQSRFYSGLSVNFSVFIQQLAGVIIMLVGMYMVEERTLTIGALMACVILSSRAIMPIGQIAALVNRYHQARSAYRNLDGVMRQPVERPRDKKFLHRPVLKGGFQFRELGFSYPRTTRPVLQGVTLNIAAKEKVAVVGRIGSGKSTLVKLLINFFEPTQGALLVDDTDIRQVDPADLRRNIAYMGQDTALMSGTLRDNIVMGRPRASDEEVLKISEITGVHDFVRKNPMGYDAPVGERGEGLSGGQRQSVALARTLLMDTPVLILDEPTNAMDSGTEDLILRNLEKFIQDKTFILVTHKPALLKLVNRLIVMDGGRVVMDGPRDTVLQALASGKITVPRG